MDRPGDIAQWNISKITTTCCQITCAIPWLLCEQLPYPSEHPRISRMRQRDKSDLPLPVLSYKYFLLRYSFSILSFYSPKPTFTAAAPPEVFKISNKGLSPPTPKSLIFFPVRRWPSTLLFLRSVYHPVSCTFTIPLFIRNSSYWTSPFFLLFFFLSLKTSRICPIRLSSLRINHTSNVSAR